MLTKEQQRSLLVSISLINFFLIFGVLGFIDRTYGFMNQFTVLPVTIQSAGAIFWDAMKMVLLVPLQLLPVVLYTSPLLIPLLIIMISFTLGFSALLDKFDRFSSERRLVLSVIFTMILSITFSIFAFLGMLKTMPNG